jgi:hypothetical protein
LKLVCDEYRTGGPVATTGAGTVMIVHAEPVQCSTKAVILELAFR